MAERPGDDNTRKEAEQERPSPLGFRELSMNEVPASATEEESEAPRRAGGLALVLFVALVGVGVVVFGSRLISNMAPGREAEERLREKASALPVWQQGVVMGVSYVAGDRVRVDFAFNVTAASDKGRDAIRKATRQVMEVAITERPGRDLYIDGYRAKEQIVRATYRAKSALMGPGGEPIPDIVVQVKGDPEEGVGAAYEASTPGAGR